MSSASGTELALSADPRRAGQLVSLSPGGAEVLASVDVVFPVLHGPYGEDGTIQGLLELAGVPYVGAGVLASAAGMDKEFTKKLLVAEGLPIGDYAVLRVSESDLDADQRARLGLPAFVKPARGGSSIGVSRVTGWDELPAAIDYARQHDPKVIVESAIIGRELECGVLASRMAQCKPAPSGRSGWPEFVVARTPFYDFATKYLDNAAELDVPAKIDDDISDTLRDLAIQAFKAIDGRGSGAGGFLPHRRRTVDQRGQHHARFHHHLDVPADVGSQWRRLPDLAVDDGRHGAVARDGSALRLGLYGGRG